MDNQPSNERSDRYLKRCITDFDYIPHVSSRCFREYGFVNCEAEEDVQKLFGLYTGLIKVLGCNLNDLHRACQRGMLRDFIKTEYENFHTTCEKMGLAFSRGEYYPWFLLHQHLVRNANTPVEHPLPCNVCQTPCETKCSGCRQVNYCSRRHQQQDWPEHKKNCFPVRIELNIPDKIKNGSVLVATRPIKQGEIFLKESPLVSGPYLADQASGDEFPVCLGCHKVMNGNSYVCSSCKWPVCSKECELAPQHANFECKLFKENKVTAIRFAQKHDYLSVTAIRLMCLKNSDPGIWEKFQRMNADPLQQCRSSFAKDFVKNFRKPRNFGKNMDEVVNILDANRKVTETLTANPRRDTHIYNLSSYTDHCCIPNSMWVIQKNGKCFVRASVAIDTGDIITASDTDLAFGTKERRQFLQFYQINCICKRCKDPTECGTYMSAVRCKKCKDGYLLPLDPLDSESQWSCDGKNCTNVEPHTFNADIVTSLRTRVDILCRQNPVTLKTVSAIEEVVKKAVRHKVHPNHYLVGLLKRRYAQVVPLITPHLDTVGDSSELEEKMVVWTKEYLQLVNVFWPGYSRFRGQILYGMQRVMFCLIFTEVERLSRSKPNERELGEKLPFLLTAFKEVLAVRKDVQEILSIEPKGGIENGLAIEVQTEGEDFAIVRSFLQYNSPL